VTAASTEAEAALDAALTLAQSGDRAAAWALAEPRLKQCPDEPGVLRKTGLVLRQCGDTTTALSLLRRALALQQTEIADLHATTGETEEALRGYRQAIESCPDLPAPYLAAAKLQRHSWSGLLLLEALYERIPGHVEANTLRTEFLRFHATHPEVARTFDLVLADDWTQHFRHLRALSEIGDFQGVLAHVSGLAPEPDSELAFHAAVFAGHAKLALATDTTRAVAKAAAMESAAAWLDPARLTARLRDAIRARQPLSMIRLGDGEARFLALTDPWASSLISPREASCIVSVIWRNWFGQPIESADPADLTALSARFVEALEGADILGVSTAPRYEKDTFHRGYLALLERAVDRVVAIHPEISLTHAFANILLHRRSPFYAELLSGLDFLGVISPHAGLAACLATQHRIAAHREYLVPGETRLPEVAQVRGAMPHFPDRYRQIMTDLRVPRPGAVYLVAAGLLGKIYCQRIRQLGGIAIDVGSVADAWMGFGTRPGLYQEPGGWVLPGR
jgi:hypothetical protein